MKKAGLIICLLLLIGCKSKTVNRDTEDLKIKPVPTAEINANQQKKAYDLGKRVLETCNTSKFKPFNETEVTQSVMENTTEERLTKTCQRFRQYYGSFIDLKLDGVYRTKQEVIYRYHALYTKKVANKELRIFVNEDNLVSAIKSMDWDEKFDSKLEGK
jgi:energy-converting hydrogenase Eha subunit F